jgi:cyclopropane-fatty-acyl-phospholipid synthase
MHRGVCHRVLGVPITTTAPLRRELARALPSRPFRVAFWDGTTLPETEPGGPTFTVRSPKAVAHALRAPGQLGVGRAYVAGELEPDDLDAALDLLNRWSPPPLDRRAQARLALAAVRAAGLTRPPKPPQAELRLSGRRHDPERDAQAVRHHYDVPTAFFALFLDPSMTYSCALFSHGAQTLEEAQAAKRELVCRKLGLQPGERLLDVGCGWGSFVIHAAQHHRVSAVGITLSPPQAEEARRRVAAAGLSDRVEIRVMDYRDVHGERFDAIASIGMVEHVGERRIDEYATRLGALLEPGGRLLNHGIGFVRHDRPPAGAFSERYVFPDGETLPLSRVSLAIERAGFEVDHVEGLPTDYARTLQHWVDNLEANLPEAERLAGAERLRVWRLYLRASRNAFQQDLVSVFQVRAHLLGTPSEAASRYRDGAAVAPAMPSLNGASAPQPAERVAEPVTEPVADQSSTTS